MYKKASAYIPGQSVFVNFERMDLFQLTSNTWYYKRLSARNSKSMGRFRIQRLLDDKTWSIRYNIPKNYRYSNSSTQWTFVSLKFTDDKYGIKLISEEIDAALADSCFASLTITHPVY